MRILPVYFLYLAIISGWWVAEGHLGYFVALPYLMTFTHNFAMIYSEFIGSVPGTSHLWSLSIEEQFYILFPLGFIFLSRRRFITVLFSLMVVSPIIRLAWSAWLSASGMNEAQVSLGVYLFPFAHFDGFAAGALLAMHNNISPIKSRVATAAWIVVALVFSLYVVVYAFVNWQLSKHFGIGLLRNLFTGAMTGSGREAFLYSIVIGAATALLMSVLACQRWIVWICAPKFLRYIGMVSFGGYLFHGILLDFWSRMFPELWLTGIAGKILMFLVVYTSAIACAAISFHCFEKRFIISKKSTSSEVSHPKSEILST